MITLSQAQSLSKKYQIDGFTIMREYLQLMFLSYLYKEKEAKKIFFKGGTAIKFLFHSSRFSEDLDFSTVLGKKDIKKLMAKLVIYLKKELTDIVLVPLHIGKNTSRFRLKYKSSDFKYALLIRLDFNHVKEVKKSLTSPLLTDFPIIVFPLINHLSESEILAEKTAALISRRKGRDFFDVWYLLERGILLDKSLIIKKLAKDDRQFNKDFLMKIIRTYQQLQLNRDLTQFLPKSQRAIIPILKEKLLDKLTDIS